MPRTLRQKKAQSLTEYSLILIVVLGAIMAMSMFSRRALMGKMADTKRYMMDTVRAAQRDVQGQAGLVLVGGTDLPDEYEPYYMQTEVRVEVDSQDVVTLGGGGSTGAFRRQEDSLIIRNIESEELPWPGELSIAVGGS